MNLDPCAAARAHFSDEIDGEPLTLGARLMVSCHLTICPPCKRVHRSLLETREALRGLRDADVDTDDEETL